MGQSLPLKPLAWSETFATGEPEIDRQHREFLDQVNGLAAAAADEAPPDAIQPLLEAIAAHERAHFAYEESVLQRIGHSDAVIHAAEHRRLERRTAALLRAFRAIAPDDRPRVLRVAGAVRGQLLDHLLYYDLQYKSLLQYQREYRSVLQPLRRH